VLDDRIDALESCEGLVRHCVCYGNYTWNEQWEDLRVSNWINFKKFVDFVSTFDNKLNK
jgi:hypothetical protein